MGCWSARPSDPLVLCLRADRVGALSVHPGFARMAERGLYLLGGMGTEELRSAIEDPARQAGLLLEPGLVDLLVRDLEGQPGALPMMSHALRAAGSVGRADAHGRRLHGHRRHPRGRRPIGRGGLRAGRPRRAGAGP